MVTRNCSSRNCSSRNCSATHSPLFSKQCVYCYRVCSSECSLPYWLASKFWHIGEWIKFIKFTLINQTYHCARHSMTYGFCIHHFQISLDGLGERVVLQRKSHFNSDCKTNSLLDSKFRTHFSLCCKLCRSDPELQTVHSHMWLNFHQKFRFPKSSLSVS